MKKKKRFSIPGYTPQTLSSDLTSPFGAPSPRVPGVPDLAAGAAAGGTRRRGERQPERRLPV